MFCCKKRKDSGGTWYLTSDKYFTAWILSSPFFTSVGNRLYMPLQQTRGSFMHSRSVWHLNIETFGFVNSNSIFNANWCFVYKNRKRKPVNMPRTVSSK